jgi:hypothetical protein
VAEDFFSSLNPDKGVYVSSYGPKGSGKSELNKRLFARYPYDGLLIDHAGDADEHHEVSEPIPKELLALTAALAPLGEAEDFDPRELAGLEARIEEAWRQDEPRWRKYRYVPNTLNDQWLERTDLVIGLAYVHGRTIEWWDEANLQIPAGRTPRWTRHTLHVGRHRALSALMPGPRPSDVDPLGLSQSDVVTVHGPMHELDVARLARSFHMRDQTLAAELGTLEPFDYLAYFRSLRELAHYPPLPMVGAGSPPGGRRNEQERTA